MVATVQGDSREGTGTRGLPSALDPIRAEAQRHLLAIAGSSGLAGALCDARGEVLWTGGNEPDLASVPLSGLVVGSAFDQHVVTVAGSGEQLTAWSEPIVSPEGDTVGHLVLMGRGDVTTDATAAEALDLLAALMCARLTGPAAPAAIRSTGLELSLLGPPLVCVDGAAVPCTPRQLEFLGVLALEGPATLERLVDRVYGDRRISAATVKAEMSHVRHLLGGAVGSRPYRLTLPVTVDAVELRRRLKRGDIAGALALYAGQLLVGSDAPFAADYRHVIDVVLRSTLLARGSPEELLAFSGVHPFDTAVLERIAGLTATDDPLHCEAIARLAVAEWSSPG